MVVSGIDRDNMILAAQTGNTDAISRLLAVCQADARRYAYKHCQASDIDDAVQESLMVIARKVKGLKAAAAFSSWLFTVIKRECRKLERAMFRHDPLPDEVAEEKLVCKTDHDLRIDLANALESLPAHYLEVVLLRDFEELTIAEIAERLGEQPGAIKSRLHRARELVREYMLGPDASGKKHPAEPLSKEAWNKMASSSTQGHEIKTRSTLTCPECGHAAELEMPTNACLYFCECETCHALLRPLPGDCCVFCSYGSTKCPPMQQDQS